MLITGKGMIVRSPIKDIRSTGRSTQGVRLIKLEGNDKVSSIAKIIPEDEDERAEAEAKPAAPAKEVAPKAEPKEEKKEALKTKEKQSPAPKKKSIKRKR
jgi:DNA gyrase subunit A